MDIYLDTSHLQKWQQETLPTNDLSKLNRLRGSGQHSFVLSIIHIFDISDREDEKKALEIAAFLDTLPKKWLRNPVDIKREEIKCAINSYKKDSLYKINPFVNDFIDALEKQPDTALSLSLMGRGSTITAIIKNIIENPDKKSKGMLTSERINSWTKSNHALIEKMKGTEIKNKEMQRNLRRVLNNDFTSLNLLEEIIDVVTTKLNRPVDAVATFINWLTKNPGLIASILCPYYALHYMHRNKTMKWEKSHIDDLNHLAALPYVDYLSVDKEMLSFAMQSLRFAKRHLPLSWDKRLIKSVSEINL